MKERAERAERERKDKGAPAHTQKQLLEYHKQVSVHKLQAVEAKYAALKKSHLGLEVPGPALTFTLPMAQGVVSSFS
jgi:hypothetical protein